MSDEPNAFSLPFTMPPESRAAFDAMRVWGEQVFGEVTAERIVERAGEEFLKDLVPASKEGFTDKATEEAADVVIIFTRFPGLWEAIERKMQVNGERRWNKRGDGTGYHIPTKEKCDDSSNR